MTTSLEYALMAGVVYRPTRNEINRFPISASSGWSEVLNSHRTIDSSGFEAISFQRGSEIVISYAGTNGEYCSALIFVVGKLVDSTKDSCQSAA